MTETVSLILAVIGTLLTWTCTVATLTFWLSTKFRHLERLIYIEQSKLDQKYMALFQEHNDRLMVLEIKREGGTAGDTPMHRSTKPSRY